MADNKSYNHLCLYTFLICSQSSKTAHNRIIHNTSFLKGKAQLLERYYICMEKYLCLEKEKEIFFRITKQ